MLIGSAMHNIDAKGRVFIPSKFRADIGSYVIICRGADGCIRAYTPEKWEKVANAYSATSGKMLRLRRRLFASAEKTELDSQGRVLLPEELRTAAAITDRTKIVGMCDWIEFWDPDKYDEVMAQEDGEDELDALDAAGLC